MNDKQHEDMHHLEDACQTQELHLTPYKANARLVEKSALHAVN
jgi:hypothetical protein